MKERIIRELKGMGLAALYFGSWIAFLLFLKQLILAEYMIAFSEFTMVLVGALILSKVVVVMEHIPLGASIRNRPAWVDVVVRTLLYSFGVLLVLLLEKGFESREEFGGFVPALTAVFNHVDIHHVWFNTVCISTALLGYNALLVVRMHLGKGELLRLFLKPLPEK